MLDGFLQELQNLDVTVPLLGSLVAGALIGGEREHQGKAAGLRTHMLLCFAAALMTLVGLRMDEWLADLPPGTQIVSDMSRMPHGILTGIGFLGAGVIFRDGLGVQGLTTAATLWLTEAIGVVFGTGLIDLAALATVIALIVLVALRFLQGFGSNIREARLSLTLPAGEGLGHDEFRAILARHGFRLMTWQLEEDRERGLRHLEAQVTTRAARPSGEALLESLRARGSIRAFGFAYGPHGAGKG